MIDYKKILLKKKGPNNVRPIQWFLCLLRFDNPKLIKKIGAQTRSLSPTYIEKKTAKVTNPNP